ncbi:hypothetical protein QOS04_28560 [Cupriavidus sp. LEh21]|nr:MULTISPECIES: hypothetical protein [unclassified Cupriavidus]MDK2660533.1 hypothetical protein [Cupriavidus sp. LEh21]
MKLSLDSARRFARDLLVAQSVPGDIADDVAEHLVEPTAAATPATASRSCPATARRSRPTMSTAKAAPPARWTGAR